MGNRCSAKCECKGGAEDSRDEYDREREVFEAGVREGRSRLAWNIAGGIEKVDGQGATFRQVDGRWFRA